MMPEDLEQREREELLKGHITHWDEELARLDTDTPDVETVKNAVWRYFETLYAADRDEMPLFYRTAAGKVSNAFRQLIMGWMRTAWPENPAIDSAFQNVVCAVRDGDSSAAEELVSRIGDARLAHDEPSAYQVRPDRQRSTQRRSREDVKTVLVAFLTKHHGYGSGGIKSFAAASSSQLNEGTGLPPSTLAGALERVFPNEDGTAHQRYRAACQAKQPLVMFLIKANGDSPPERPHYSLRDDDSIRPFANE
jgi:hypothetical protein